MVPMDNKYKDVHREHHRDVTRQGRPDFGDLSEEKRTELRAWIESRFQPTTTRCHGVHSLKHMAEVELGGYWSGAQVLAMFLEMGYRVASPQTLMYGLHASPNWDVYVSVTRAR